MPNQARACHRVACRVCWLFFVFVGGGCSVVIIITHQRTTQQSRQQASKLMTRLPQTDNCGEVGCKLLPGKAQHNFALHLTSGHGFCVWFCFVFVRRCFGLLSPVASRLVWAFGSISADVCSFAFVLLALYDARYVARLLCWPSLTAIATAGFPFISGSIQYVEIDVHSTTKKLGR